jgi:hypothetical protein
MKGGEEDGSRCAVAWTTETVTVYTSIEPGKPLRHGHNSMPTQMVEWRTVVVSPPPPRRLDSMLRITRHRRDILNMSTV